MSVLGVIARARPNHLDAVREAIARIAGVDVALESPDGRLILVIEDSADHTAAAAMAEIASHPLVINTSLVYEYSGDDGASDGLDGYNAWRSSMKDLQQGTRTA